MKISNRLKIIASFVLEDAYLLDVGCDHALLDVYVVMNRKNVRAVASDIREKPLIQAKLNVLKYGLQDKIELALGNGLDTIKDNIDTVVIAGMGTSNILDILSNGDLTRVKRLIISSNNDYYELRKKICKLGFKIVDEAIVFERNKYYPIIVFEKGKVHYKRIELREGPFLIAKKDDIFKKYIYNKQKKLEKILSNLDKGHFLTKVMLKKEISDLKRIN